MPLRSVTRIALLSLVLAEGAGATERSADNEAYYGNYRVAENHVLGINPFITDAGEQVVFFADYNSGVVGPLSRISGSRFRLGDRPSDLTIEFMRDDKGGQVRGMRLQTENQAAQLAEALPLRREEVAFPGTDAKLVGTLISPATPGPHPAIVLLHGSGPLTRHSFGPYPHFFTSLGMAVLVYDKRGTGGSTGDGWETFLDGQGRLIESRSWFFQTRGQYSSVEQMQFDWDRILSFDPLPQLALVKCPVLGVFGELDTSTPSARAAANMRRVLTEAQHKDVSTIIFSNASHSLMELPSRKRMAPGVFEALRTWLRDRLFASPTPAHP